MQVLTIFSAMLCINTQARNKRREYRYIRIEIIKNVHRTNVVILMHFASTIEKSLHFARSF